MNIEKEAHYEPTISELLLIISKLEERILALEHKQHKNSGIHLTGAPKSAKSYYENKKKELERLGGDK